MLTLLIDRGDLPSLVAGVIQPDPSRVVLWHVRERDAAAARRMEVVERHRRLLDTADLIISEPCGGAAAELSAVRGIGTPEGGLSVLGSTLLLLQATAVAHRLGCGRILWPLQVGPDPSLVGAAVECSSTMTELAGLSFSLDDQAPSREGPVIDLPLVDLDDEQIVDLADDCGVPPRAFWPCDFGEPDPCTRADVCDGCRRWQGAFSGFGLPWPWERVTA